MGRIEDDDGQGRCLMGGYEGKGDIRIPDLAKFSRNGYYESPHYIFGDWVSLRTDQIISNAKKVSIWVNSGRSAGVQEDHVFGILELSVFRHIQQS